MSEKGFTPEGAADFNAQVNKARMNDVLGSPEHWAQAQPQPIEAPKQQHHGIDVMMHPGEWHPLHSLRVALEARHRLRGGKPRRTK